jgi:hypothetical protein
MPAPLRLAPRYLSIVALLAFVLLATADPAAAAWGHDPLFGTAINSFETYNQAYAVVPDGSGGAYVAYTLQYAGADHIYVQRVTAAGDVAPGWGADGTQVRGTSGLCSDIVMTATPDGVIVAWIDYRTAGKYGDVYAGKVLADRSLAPGWTANGMVVSTRTYNESDLQILSDEAGGAYLAWVYEISAGNLNDIYGAHVTSGGTLALNQAIKTGTYNQNSPRIAANGRGGIVLFYSDDANGTGANADVYLESFSSTFSVLWGPRAIAVTTGAQTAQAVQQDANGGYWTMWLDARSAPVQVYAAWADSTGDVPQEWGVWGIPAGTSAGVQANPQMVLDGTGGALFAWEDERSGNKDIYVQRMRPSGIRATGWGTSGSGICTVANDQYNLGLVPDGSGGAVLAWVDDRNSSVYMDLYAGRLTASGSVPNRWTSSGTPLLVAPDYQDSLLVASDGAGGLIVAWREFGWIDYYTTRLQHMDTFGALGDAGPAITAVADVPADQGGKVLVTWDASYLDAVPGIEVGKYWIWRSIPMDAAERAVTAGARWDDEPATVAAARGASASAAVGGERLLHRSLVEGVQTAWEWIGEAPASAFPSYSYVAATTTDSMAGSNPLTTFMVQARYQNSAAWWDSDPVAGYSVDDLAPATPAPFTGTYAARSAYLQWGQSAASDFAEYRLYRGLTPQFVPGLSSLVATQPTTGYVDAAVDPSYYKLCAVDLHGNVSPYAFLQPSGSVDVSAEALPREVFLAPPAPNPARSGVALRFGLPREAPVTLAVHDAAGRRVRGLLSGTLPAGEHPVTWDLRDDAGRAVPDGIYFVRMTAEHRTLTTRVLKLR